MIPSIIVDNFFEEPDKVVEFANSLEYNVLQDNYPGARTERLSDEFSDKFAEKVFSNFPFTVNSYDLHLSFQKITDKFETGFIHIDTPTQLTGIVYLNEEDNTGTSLYSFNGDHNKILKTLDNRNPDAEKLLKHNKQFKKTVDVENVYNRAFIFDASTPHCANGFSGNERLTLIGFFKDIKISI